MRSGAPLDLGAAERRELRRRAEPTGLPPLYRSPVLAERIVVTPSKRQWWIATGAISAILGALAFRWLGAETVGVE